MKKLSYVILAVTIILSGCAPTKKPLASVQKMEVAHYKAQFTAKKAIQFNLKLTFGGKERLNGRITTTMDGAYGLIELENGSKMYIQQDKVYCSPELESSSSTRFDAYTWTYFFLFPYKLTDEGTQWSEFGTDSLDNQRLNTQKLTFGEGIGDSPEDWYIVYADPQTNRIQYAAYIVTARKSKEEAEKDPHAIQYLNYQEIDGIPIAHDWLFWEWRQEKGLTKQLGTASLTNIHFMDNIQFLTEIPDNYIIR